jgi:hypothetical protein
MPFSFRFSARRMPLLISALITTFIVSVDVIGAIALLIVRPSASFPLLAIALVGMVNVVFLFRGIGYDIASTRTGSWSGPPFSARFVFRSNLSLTSARKSSAAGQSFVRRATAPCALQCGTDFTRLFTPCNLACQAFALSEMRPGTFVNVAG